jgi:hypothetical protein
MCIMRGPNNSYTAQIVMDKALIVFCQIDQVVQTVQSTGFSLELSIDNPKHLSIGIQKSYKQNNRLN